MDPVKFQSARKPADMAFLALAVLVHAALLMVPLKDWRDSLPAVAPRLTVDLRQLPPQPRQAPAESIPAQAPAEPEAAPAEKAEAEKPAAEVRRTASITIDQLPPEPQRPPIKEPAPQQELLSAQQLRELLRQADLPQQDSRAVRQLGSAQPWQPPANWQKHAGAPYLADSENRFNGMTVPEDVEIVDRWMASDGSHNVVVNSPNGETLCGRAEAYNPLQPLVEPVMMWRPCGGGGKRTFSMPDRYKRGQ